MSCVSGVNAWLFATANVNTFLTFPRSAKISANTDYTNAIFAYTVHFSIYMTRSKATVGSGRRRMHTHTRYHRDRKVPPAGWAGAGAGAALPPPVLGELMQLLHEGGHDCRHRDVDHVLHVGDGLFVGQIQPGDDEPGGSEPRWRKRPVSCT